jgi:hypothetical protein
MTPIQQSKDTDLIARLGRSLIEAGRLTREALATYAAAHYVGIGLVLPETPRTLQPVIRVTGAQPFDSPTATFQTIPLTKLIDVTEGDKVEITGLITNIETPPVPAEYEPVSYIHITGLRLVPGYGSAATTATNSIFQLFHPSLRLNAFHWEHPPKHRGAPPSSTLRAIGRRSGQTSLISSGHSAPTLRLIPATCCTSAPVN